LKFVQPSYRSNHVPRGAPSDFAEISWATPRWPAGACRSYIEATVVPWTASGYQQQDRWICNNSVDQL